MVDLESFLKRLRTTEIYGCPRTQWIYLFRTQSGGGLWRSKWLNMTVCIKDYQAKIVLSVLSVLSWSWQNHSLHGLIHNVWSCWGVRKLMLHLKLYKYFGYNWRFCTMSRFSQKSFSYILSPNNVGWQKQFSQVLWQNCKLTVKCCGYRHDGNS